MALTDIVGAGTDRLSAVLRALRSGRTYHDALQLGVDALVAETDLLLAQVWTLDEALGRLELTGAGEPRGRTAHERLRADPVALQALMTDALDRPMAPHMRILEESQGVSLSGSERPLRIAALPLEVSGRRVGVLAVFAVRELSPAELRALVPIADLFSLAAASGFRGHGSLISGDEVESRLLSAILDQLPTGVLVADLDGKIIKTNRTVEEAFGGSLIGRDPAAWAKFFVENATFIDGRPITMEDIPLLRAMRENVVLPAVEVRSQVPVDTTLSIRAAPVRGDYGEPIAGVATFSDVTATHSMLDELAAAKRQLDRQVADLQTLSGLFERLSAVGELQPLLNETLAVLCEVLDTDKGVVLLRSPDGDALRFAATFGFDRETIAILQSIPSEDMLSATAATMRHSVTIRDLTADRARTDVYRQTVLRAGIIAIHAVPLIAPDGEELGCIATLFGRPRDLTEREERIVEACAAYASRLIANAQVHAREHDVAQTLQRSMLLSHLPAVPSTELAVRYRPGTVGMQAGGDWYDALVLPDGTLGLMIGDVVGHGVHAASIMGQLRSALRAYALVEWEEPAGVLDYLDHFVRSTGVGEMTTATFLTVDPATCRVRLANAGHYPPLLLAAEGASYLEAGLNIPLGVSVNVETTDIEMQLEPGCVLLLYTDGLVERRGESVDDGLNRLRDAALSGPEDLDELCDHLLRECAPEGGSADDIAMLAVRLLG